MRYEFGSAGALHRGKKIDVQTQEKKKYGTNSQGKLHTIIQITKYLILSNLI